MSDKDAGAGSTSRKGKVHFIKTNRGLFPVSVIKEAEVKPKSKQLKEDVRYMSEHGLVPQPLEYVSLYGYQEACTYFDASVRQIATDVVLTGYEIISREEGKDVIEAEKIAIETLLTDVNTEQEIFVEIATKMVVDWGSVGMMAAEISRAADGKVDSMFHIPAYSLRVHHTKNKYCQFRKNKKRWFKRFGYEPNVDMETGVEGGDYGDLNANEALFYVNYFPQNDYYGAPNILPAIGAVAGFISSREYNLSFFENYGIPAAVVTLGGDWEENSAKQISDFIDTEVKRSGNAHKTIVMELPDGGELKWEPLVVEVKEGSFKIYMKDLRDEILVAYKMPPYRVGITETGSLGGNIAGESTKIYNQSVVQPLKNVLARLFNESVIKDGLGIENTIIRFKKLDTRDMDSMIKRWKELFGMGAINVNYMLEQLSLESVTHGDDYYILNQYVLVGEETFERAIQTLSQEELDDKIAEQVEAQVKRLNPSP